MNCILACTYLCNGISELTNEPNFFFVAPVTTFTNRYFWMGLQKRYFDLDPFWAVCNCLQKTQLFVVGLLLLEKGVVGIELKDKTGVIF